MKIIHFILLSLLITDVFSQNKNITSTSIKYDNIIILSDLSSRLSNRPQKDLQEINKIISYFRNQCVKPGQKIGDKSSIYFSIFSKKANDHIDLEEYVEINKKQSFVNSKGIYLNKGLDYEIANLKSSINNYYKSTRNNGLDLLSILIEKIQNDLVIKNKKIVSDGNMIKIFDFNNHIYLFTDGYLEFQTNNASRQFYFGKKEIDKIRNYCVKNNVNINTALFKSPNLGLPSAKSHKNHLINLHILETHERDKNLNTQTYKNSFGLRDNEILEAVWRKWAVESGFKSFEWKKY